MTQSPLLHLATSLRGHGGWFWASFASTVTVQVTAALISALSAWVTAHAVREQPYAGLALGLVVALVTYGLMTWVESWVSHALAYRVLAVIRSDLHTALTRVAPVGLGKRRIGDVVARTMGDVEVLEWFFAHTAAAALSAVVVPVGMITFATVLIGPIGLFLFVPAVLLIAVPLLLTRLEKRAGKAHREAVSALKVDVLTAVEGLRDLVLSRSHGRARSDVDQATRTVQRNGLRLAVVRGLQSAGVEVVLAGTSLLVITTMIVQAGRTDTALIPVIAALSGGALAPVSGLSAMLMRIGEISAAADRCLNLINAPDPLKPTLSADQGSAGARGIGARGAGGVREAGAAGIREAGAGAVAGEPGAGIGAGASGAAVAFENVTYSYPDGTPVLENVSFEVAAGETVALVGPSGSGKTTCAHLLLRFADPDSGRVLLHGADMRTIIPEDIREMVGLIPQHGFIFAQSIADNLRLGAPQAETKKMWSALEQVGLKERVESLPDGLEGVSGERGNTLSGGEKQRLAIARAFLADREILVMDEPLANVDAATERQVLNSTAQLRDSHTTIVIAHRLAGIEAADRVVFLLDGRVAGIGTHTQLLQDSRYREMLAQQIAEAGETES